MSRPRPASWMYIHAVFSPIVCDNIPLNSLRVRQKKSQNCIGITSMVHSDDERNATR